MKTMDAVKELFNELTLVHINEPQPLVENQARVKVIKAGMEGLLKVLIWRLEGSISPEEFR